MQVMKYDDNVDLQLYFDKLWSNIYDTVSKSLSHSQVHRNHLRGITLFLFMIWGSDIWLNSWLVIGKILNIKLQSFQYAN